MHPPRLASDGNDEQAAHRAGKGPLTGRLLSGRWRVGKLLGRGGMSAVYAAAHRNGKACAIKVLHSELAGKPRSRRRFLREGYIANRVGHEGVVSVLDDDVTEDGVVFLVMDLLEGTTLDEYSGDQGGRLAASDVLPVVEVVLDILAAAHAKGIVHRDVKPSNVFLTAKGTVKLLDFGIASLRETSMSTSATASGFVLGTPGYISPEQARGRYKEIDARTDLWGVGAMMFRLLTGRYVHEGETTHESVIAAATRPAPSLASIDPSLPAGLVQLVDRALMTDPRDRWQSAIDMQAAIRIETAKLPDARIPRPNPARDPATLEEHSISHEMAWDTREQLDGVARAREKVRPPRRWLIYAGAALALGLVSFMVARRFWSPDPADTLLRRASVADPRPAPAADRPTGSETERHVGEPPAAAPAPSATPLVVGSTSPPAPSSRSRTTRRGASSPSGSPAPGASPPTRLEDVLNERN
jgi:serine/threonine-protein kinase